MKNTSRLFSLKSIRYLGVTLIVIVCTALSCATPGKDTAIGAGAGAGGGAAIGGAIGGWKGAAIGAGIGAAAGAAVGNYLDKQKQELEKVAATKKERDGLLVKLKSDLLFDVGSSTLKPDAIAQLNQLGDILAKYDKDRIKVGGFTDNTGSAETNMTLSNQRAQTVREVLISRGVNDQRIATFAFGEAQPVASNDSSQGRQMNRRVELKIDVPTEDAKKMG
jgi:outer membrane protein OmpA-like peptidoglycan-associated protein